MEYLCDKDYNYILNKYHDVSKPYDIRFRFVRHDEIFDESTGLDGDLIKENIIKNDKEISHLPHPIRKAKAFEYVLDNTKISCDMRDIFPAINMIDRPLNDTIVKEWRREVFSDIIPETEKRRAFIEKSGACAMWPDYDHSVPVWERLFSLGFKGILEDCEKRRAELSGKRELSVDEDDFFEGVKITYTAIVNFIGRLYELAVNTKGSEKMAKALCNIKDNPPSTFYEALLVDYIYFMLSEHIEGLQVRSLSNFDVVFYPYYKKDLENGMTEEDIRKDLAYFFMQFASIDNYWGQPVFLGGCKEDESTQINELSYIFLDVYDKMNIYNPKIQIKIAKSTPKDFILKALDMIRRGNNSIVFVCDATIRKALERAGCTKEEARTCDVKGCYEYAVKGAMGCGMNYLNLLKPLEFAMHEGCDGILTTVFIKGCPLKCVWCHNPEGIDFKSQLAYYENKCIGCGECADVCEANAHSIENGLHKFDREKCISCGNCESVCLGNALTFYGREMSVDELLPKLLEDKEFYDSSNGGVTLSGGECLMHTDFCAELLKKLKENGVHTAVDTCGFVTKETLDKVIPYTDIFLYDIKAIDESVHKKCTDVSNDKILENIKYLDEKGCKIEVRIPFVPEYNDCEIEDIAKLLKKLKNLTKVRVLPYHNYAGSKYTSLDMKNNLPTILPTDEELENARGIISNYGIKVM